MDRAQASQIKPKRQLGEPGDMVGPFFPMIGELSHRHRMLPDIFPDVGPQEVPLVVGQMVVDRVVFMIAHDRQCIARGDHATNDLKNAPDRRSAVHVVAEENHLPTRRVIPGASSFLIAQSPEQPFQRFGVSVDVADEIDTDKAEGPIGLSILKRKMGVLGEHL
jgi:hypothetical protein